MKERVKIDVDYINAYLHRNKFTASEFSKHLGYCSNWWAVLKSQKKSIVIKEAAQAMCEHFGFAWTDIVLEEYATEKKNEQKKAPQKRTEQKRTDFDEFVRILSNIDEKLAYIEQRLEKLKWLEK